MGSTRRPQSENTNERRDMTKPCISCALGSYTIYVVNSLVSSRHNYYLSGSEQRHQIGSQLRSVPTQSTLRHADSIVHLKNKCHFCWGLSNVRKINKGYIFKHFLGLFNVVPFFFQHFFYQSDWSSWSSFVNIIHLYLIGLNYNQYFF